MIGTAILALIVLIVVYQLINTWVRSLRVEKYNEKYVIISGCDSGFGRQLAIRLDNIGFHVFAGCFTTEGKESLERKCSSRIRPISLDVTSDESIASAVEFVKETLPPGKGIWAVVNNAGIFGNMLTPEMLKKKDYNDILAVNFLGPVEMIRNFLPLIRKEQGRIVNVSSIMGRYSLIVAPYCASKTALEGYLDVLRKEVYGQGIRVCILQPGSFATNLFTGLEETMQAGFDQVPEEIKRVYGSDFVRDRVTLFTQYHGNTDLKKVIDAYEHSLTATFPHSRYVIGLDSKLFLIPLSYMPEWFSDTLIYFFGLLGTKRLLKLKF